MMKKKLTIYLLLCCLLLTSPLTALAATVLIDPGHGGSDPGAIGVTGLREKEVNLDIALQVRDELVRQGYEVIMTRSSDEYLSLQERIEIANRVMPDILVSIHANSYHSPDVSGTLVLYYDNRYPSKGYPASEAMKRLTPESRKLAESLLASAVQAAGTTNRGLLESSVYMVRMGAVPSALIETAFLSNPGDEQLLRSDVFRQKMAIGIANGIRNYLPAHFSDVALHWAKDSILRLYELAVVEGDGRFFYPERSLTRAEFVTILDRSGMLDPEEAEQEDEPGSEGDWGAGDQQDVTDSVYGDTYSDTPDMPVHLPVPNDEAQADEEAETELPSFTDLSEEHWAYGSMMKAVSQGILLGFPDGSIRPDASISRAEVTAIMDRLLSDDEQAESAPFHDVPEDGWYAEAVNRLYRKQIVYGVTSETFAPHKIMTRAEAAVLIDRTIHIVMIDHHIA
jgi:N-acetylmuramoyl-L-alanine amidase